MSIELAFLPHFFGADLVGMGKQSVFSVGLESVFSIQLMMRTRYGKQQKGDHSGNRA
jgi:hypothetical protein